MTYPLGLLKRYKAITTLIIIITVTVASSQPLYFHSEISLNNINFYTTPPEKLKASQYYVITVFKVNISNTPKKRRIKKGKILYFSPIDNPVRHLNWLLKGKLFHITFFKYFI